MAARALTTLLMMPLMACALERLDDSSMSDVVAQEGVVLRSEYEIEIDSVQYFDEDDYGSITMSDINLSTRSQQVIDLDIVSGDVGSNREGRNGIRFSNQELPIDLSVDAIKVNGKSLGGFGMRHLDTGGVNPLVVDVWAGGYDLNENTIADESGFTVDVTVPKETTYDLYYTDDGSELSMTIDHCSSYSGGACSSGGIVFSGMTFDVTDEGLRIGIPEVAGGQINIRNFRLNESVINDITLKNFTIPTGGYLNLGAPDVAGESAINFDAYFADGSGFDFIYYDSSDADVQELNATVSFNALDSDSSDASTNYFSIQDSSINVLSGSDNGIYIALGDADTGTGGIRGSMSINDIMLKPEGTATAPILGSVKVNLEILPGSYLEVMGH
jgi:hypothetical protein